MDQETTPQDDLAFIRKMMDGSRALIKNDGREFLAIGLTCVLGTLLSYAFAYAGAAAFIPWIWALFIAGIAGTEFVLARSKKARPKSAAESYIGAAWLAAVVAGGAILGGGALAGKMDLSLGMGVTSAFVGVGYAFTAYASRSIILGVLSIFWWIGALILPGIGGYGAPAGLAALTFCLEVVPGIVLALRSRRTENDE
jgi:hypothetical protein